MADRVLGKKNLARLSLGLALAGALAAPAGASPGWGFAGVGFWAWLLAWTGGGSKEGSAMDPLGEPRAENGEAGSYMGPHGLAAPNKAGGMMDPLGQPAAAGAPDNTEAGGAMDPLG